MPKFGPNLACPLHLSEAQQTSAPRRGMRIALLRVAQRPGSRLPSLDAPRRAAGARDSALCAPEPSSAPGPCKIWKSEHIHNVSRPACALPAGAPVVCMCSEYALDAKRTPSAALERLVVAAAVGLRAKFCESARSQFWWARAKCSKLNLSPSAVSPGECEFLAAASLAMLGALAEPSLSHRPVREAGGGLTFRFHRLRRQGLPRFWPVCSLSVSAFGRARRRLRLDARPPACDLFRT